MALCLLINLCLPINLSGAVTDREHENGSTKEPVAHENPFMRAMRVIDRRQRSNKVASFSFGVVKKYGDDNGGSLAALLTYYGFLSVFPLLLVLVTVVGIVAGSHAGLEKRIVNSALSQFPVIGNELGSNIKTLHDNSPAGLTIGLLGLVWGSTGVCQSAQYAMAQVWNIPKVKRPGFVVLGSAGQVSCSQSARSFSSSPPDSPGWPHSAVPVESRYA